MEQPTVLKYYPVAQFEASKAPSNLPRSLKLFRSVDQFAISKEDMLMERSKSFGQILALACFFEKNEVLGCCTAELDCDT